MRMHTVLGDRDWKIRHSLWLLWPLMSLGLFTWIGFAYIAGMARRRTWTVYAALYGVGFLVTLILFALVVPPPNETRPGETDTASGLVGIYLLTLWVGGSAHAAVVNRSWLRWRARSGTVPLPAPRAGPPAAGW
jgi:hypothetical protein